MSRFKETPGVGQKSKNINEGAEVKTEQDNGNGSRRSTEKLKTKNGQKREDSTQISAEYLVGTVTGDPWEWYCSELEKGLGKERAQQWLDMTEEQIEAQIEEMKDFPDGDDDGEMSDLAKLYHRKTEEEKKLEFCPVKLDDFTPEAMVMHGINHGRVFISSDEGGIIADILCGRYSKGFTNDGPMCKIWSNSYLSRKRKDGLIWRDRVTGSALLMGQEHITEQMFQNEDMVTSGFIPRFLFAAAETPMLYRDKSSPSISEEARGNYRDVIINGLQKHWSELDGEGAITIDMTEEAQDALDDFHNSYVDRGNTTLADAKRSLHRIAEQATRIALIFHVAKVYGSMGGLNSDATDINEPVCLSTVQAAIKVTEWSLQSYLEYSRPGREDTVDELESEVLSKAKKIGEPFTVREMQRKIRSKKFTGSEHIASVLGGLVKKGKMHVSEGEYSFK